MSAPFELIESIKRLYEQKKLTKKQVKDRVKSGALSEEEYKYITGEPYA